MSSDKTPLFIGEQTQANAAQHHAALAVKVLQSPDAALLGRVFPLVHRFCFGRAAGNEVNLVIGDELLSRQHASLERRGNAVTLHDHNSTNGTFVLGQRVTEQTLMPGSIVRAGETLFYVGVCALSDAPYAGTLQGTSLAIRELRSQIATFATSHLPLMIIGETGTGKELIARDVHTQSGRTGKLVSVNCAAIPASLSEAVFFGHKKGAFTGALQDEEGHWLAAEGGTLFLDEVADLSLELQAKLLRVLDNGEITPVGSSRTIQTNVRVLAATNLDLSERVRAGKFRADLFARLQGYILKPPPLRDRVDDILQLFDHFWRVAQGKPIPRSTDFAEQLLRYRWPLNVRELKTIAERTVRLAAKADMVTSDFLPEEIVSNVSAITGGESEPDREAIEQAMVMYKGNVVQVAKHFGRDRKQVYRWIKKYDFSTESFRK